MRQKHHIKHIDSLWPLCMSQLIDKKIEPNSLVIPFKKTHIPPIRY